MSKVTQRTPLFNPNNENIPEQAKVVGTDGCVYIKMKEKNSRRYRWKKTFCKEINDNKEYFTIRLNCIQYAAKRWGPQKIPMCAKMVSLTPFVADPTMQHTLFGLNKNDYQTYLLFAFLDFHSINPVELFKLKLEKTNAIVRRIDFTIDPHRLTNLIKKIYSPKDVDQLPAVGKTGILLYLAIKDGYLR